MTATDTDDAIGFARTDQDPPRATTKIAGRYLVLEKLGEGGMGVVHRAYDPALRREVALKVVRVADSLTARERLLREAQALAQVTDPNVVAIYDVGSLDEDVFLAMELIKGETFADWLRRERRLPSEVLASFRAAGRGLAAAHGAGLVHRDFKPANVMVGEDGRVRVLDFGLARLAGESPGLEIASPVDSPDHLNNRITRQGAVLGTPRYMAPEQRSSGTADERSDQYAFCVALHEALGGEPPTEAAAPPALPALPGITRRARDAILRGLSLDPAKRFASMTDLLDELGPKRRPVVWIVGAAILVVALGTGLAVRSAAPEAIAPCGAVAAPFEQLWSTAARDRIRRSFIASGVPSAEATWGRLVPLVDRWGKTWVDTRREACAATQVRGEQSPALMDLRMGCLDDRRRELGALLDVFGTADPDVVAASLKAVSQLEPIERCNDAAALANVAPPKPAIAATVEQHQLEIEAIAASVRAMKVKGTVERAEKAVAAATTVGYAPLEARARFELGVALNTDGQYKPALASLEAAALAADRAGDDRLRARAWSEAVFVAGSSLRQSDDAFRARSHAQAALDRIRDPGTLPLTLHLYTATTYWALGKHKEGLGEIDAALALVTPATEKLHHANVLNQRGLLLDGLARYQEALDAYAEARKLFEADFGPDHPRIAMVLSNSANALGRLVVPDEKGPWKLVECERLHREALAISERAFGSDHPQVATYLNNVVNVLLRAERYPDALPLARRAVDIRERKLPADHPLTVRAVINVGSIIAGTGNYDEAEPYFVRGLEMQTRSLPNEHPDIAYARMLHGINLLDLGRNVDARAELERSYAVYSKAQAPDSPQATLAMSWHARALVDAGDAKAGLARADQALAIALSQEKLFTEGVARWHRARALVALGRRREAVAEAKTAIDELAKQPVTDTNLLRAKIEKWLAALGN